MFISNKKPVGLWTQNSLTQRLWKSDIHNLHNNSCLFNKRQFQLDRCHKIPMSLKRLPVRLWRNIQIQFHIWPPFTWNCVRSCFKIENSTSQFKFSSKCIALDQSYFLGGKMAFHNLQLQFLCGLFIWQTERLFGIIYGTSKRFHNTFCVHQYFATFGFFFNSAAQNIRTASSRMESCWRRRNIKTCKVDTAWMNSTHHHLFFPIWFRSKITVNY